MIKFQSEKAEDDDKFFGAFEKLATNGEQFICIGFVKRNIRSLRNLIHRYLNGKWTYSNINKFYKIENTENSRVNWIKNWLQIRYE